MNTYITGLRRSTLRWWLPILILLDIWVLFGRSTLWIGIWPEASAAAQLGSFFFGLALAMASAWASSASRRFGVIEMTAQGAIGSFRRELASIAVSLSYGFVVLLVGAVIAAIASFPEAGPGFLWPSYLLLGASMVALCIAIGHLVGRVLPPILSSAAAFAAVFSISIFFRDSYGQNYLYVLSGPVQAEIELSTLLPRIGLSACAVLFAAAVVAPHETPARRWHRDRRTPAAIGVACLVGLSIIAVLLTGQLRVTRQPPETALCSDTEITVCLWPESSKYLDPASRMADRAAGLGDDLLTVPTAFYELGLRQGARGQNDFTTDLGAWSISSAMSAAIFDATSGETICEGLSEDEETSYYQAIFELVSWLEVYLYGGPRPAGIQGGPPGVDPSALAAVVRQSVERQKAWANDRLERIDATCP